MRLMISFLLFAGLITQGYSQGTMLLRQPTISGDRVASVYANDIWIAPLAGGDAYRITSSVGAETDPHFSPGGEWIAFTGQYDGNTDVYIIPSAGGEPQRLTWHPGRDIVQGWTPDGKHVIFQSGRESVPTLTSRLYRVAIDGGTPEPLTVRRAAFGEISPDGKYLAYTPFTFWDPEWRNYRGGQAQPIWIVDLETLELRQTPRTDGERHMDPVWVANKVFFLSERDYASNIWSYDINSNELKQHTFHADFDVKSLDADGDRIIYEQGGYLHLLNTDDDSATRLSINPKGDFHWARERWEKINPLRFTGASLSPGGKRVLMEYRGEIFTVPAEKGSWRNISNSAGVADRSPVWSPDGSKIAWFNDENGEYELVLSSQDGKLLKRISIPGASFFFKPQWSPDSKYIAFTDTHYNLWYAETGSGIVKKADTDMYAHPNRTMNPVWSPDSRWIAYPALLESQYKAIFVYNVVSGQKYQVTDGMADAVSPVWDASGKYLYFLASTNYGLGTGWLDMSSYNVVTTRSLYVALLGKDVKSPFLPESDEAEVEKAEKDEKESVKKKKTEKVSTEEKEESESKNVEVKIDPDGIQSRILEAGIPEGNYLSLENAPEGEVFVLENKEGSSGITISKYILKEKELKKFLEGASLFVSSFDRKKILYRSGSTWGIADTKASSVKSGDGKIDLSDISVKINPKEEWQQIYREGWRYQRDFLYVDNVHGAPWEDVYRWYKPWVDHVRHRSEMSYIIDILGGEVAVGHSYTSGGDFPDVSSVNIGLLGADYEISDNKFRIKKIYTGENWNSTRGPLSEPGLGVAEGDYILAVNGINLDAGKNFYSLFEGTAGRHTSLKIGKADGTGSIDIIVIPVQGENALRTNDWIESNRKKVSELSGGKLAYVWLPNTGQGGFNSFNRYYFAQQHLKGAVIDERNNGGGSAADYIVDILSRDLMGYFNSKAKNKRPFTQPMAGLWGPKVMIINERAGSGGDLMPYLFKEMEIGPLVGTRTWGGLVGTWDTPPFIDGGRMVAPRGGFINADGEWDVEGKGISPDIEVIQDPALEAAGKDPQLEKAVEVALKLLETEEVVLKPEPPAPIRWKRPDYFKK